MTAAGSITCTGLGKRYGTIVAASGVNLDIRPGRFVALLGPSGCGKTTILRLIAGLESPDEGEIHLSGQVVSTPATQLPPEKREVGMVFQDYALFPHMTVEDNIAYGVTDTAHRDTRVTEVLDLVGLASLRDRMPHELSGGQQQRVALARALAPDPQLILLDEPFSNLDAALRTRVRQEMKDILTRAGVTSLIVTHDQEEALSLADELAVMMDGRIEQVGTPRHVYLHPATHRVATFLGEANFLPGEGQGLYTSCELGRLELVKPFTGSGEIMFRPEDLAITASPEGNARVLEKQFFGHDQLLKVQLTSGTVLQGRLLGAREPMEAGQPVQVGLGIPVTMFPSAYGCPVIEL